MFLRLLASCACLSIATLSLAQEFPERWSTTLFGVGHTPLGSTLVDDLNGDGLPDLAVVTASPGTFFSAGSHMVDFRCGRTGAFLHASPSRTHTALFSVPEVDVHCIGDIDGDGCRDVFTFEIGISAASRFLVFSSATGTLIHDLPVPNGLSVNLSANVSLPVGDQNFDGISEIAVLVLTASLSTPGSDDIGYEILDPATGLTLLSTQPTFGLHLLGTRHRLFEIQDINADGIADLVAVINPGGMLSTTFLSGDDSSVLGATFGTSSEALGVVGDTDADGEMEVVYHDGPSLTLVNVPSGSVRGSIPAPTGFLNGAPFAISIGDADGDEIDDFAAAVPIFGSSALRLRSGSNLRSQTGALANLAATQFRGGQKLFDYDGDGTMEFLLRDQNSVRAMSMGGAVGYGSSAATTLDLGWNESVTAATTHGNLDLTGGTPSGMGLVAVSLGPDQFAVMGIPILIDPSFLAFPSSIVSFDSTGSWRTPIPLGVLGLQGTSLFIQAFDITSGPTEASNGLEMHFLVP